MADFEHTFQSSTRSEPPAPADDVRALDDLTLAELAGLLWRAPRQTLKALHRLLVDGVAITPLPIAIEEAPQADVVVSDEAIAEKLPTDAEPSGVGAVLQNLRLRLLLYICAFGVALWGNSILANQANRTSLDGLAFGSWFLLGAFLLWLGADLLTHRQAIVAWWQGAGRFGQLRWLARLVPLFLILNGLRILALSSTAPLEAVIALVGIGLQSIVLGIGVWVVLEIGAMLVLRAYVANPSAFPQDFIHISPRTTDTRPTRTPPTAALTGRFAMVSLAALLTYHTYTGTGGNVFQSWAFYSWLASIALWSYAFAPLHWRPMASLQGWWARLRGWRFRNQLVVWGIFALIFALAAYFRFDDIGRLPPEMTSDHLEKLFDSYRVANGARDIFFSNNGGREPFQMYAMAFLAQFPGFDINFSSLKLLAIIESLLTLPILVWMGREVIGSRNPRLGMIVGLALAALVAVSYWHVAITRLSLRIVLTPLVTALLIIYLTRALRRNQRADFIKAGLVLGFGLYTYQAVRMLPMVVVIGVGIAILLAHDWRERGRYALNLLVLAFIAFIVFVPMFHYSVDYPDDFWRRTSGRLLGDAILEDRLEDGTIVYRQATLQERVDAFVQNIPILTYNIRNALLMFNWKGDVAWINGAPNYPTMDPFSGALLIVGLAAWLVWLIRYRDAADILMPIALFVMLMPSALSIAYPIENPSHTRTSGALAMAYLLAAFPMALIVDKLLEVIQSRPRYIAVGLFCGIIILGAYTANRYVYFNPHREAYLNASLPHSEAGAILKGFALSGGSYGNAFVLAYPYWWDYRIVGLEAGLFDWPNGVKDPDGDNFPALPADTLPTLLKDNYWRSDAYRFDPERGLLFFLNRADTAQLERLQSLFPQGWVALHRSYQPNEDFVLFNVPALGLAGFEAFLAQHDIDLYAGR